MKQQERRHPPINLTYKDFYFCITEPEIGSVALILPQISIKFQDHLKGYSYSALKVLQHVSYKTVITALQQTEPLIIKSLIIPVQEGYELIIKVALQYLNQIQEVIIFRGQKMGEERRKQLMMNTKVKQQVQSIKKKLKQSQKQYIITGVLNNRQKKLHQIFIDVPFEVTLNTITLNFRKLTQNVIKVGYYYFDRVTNSKVSQNMLPDEVFSNGITQITLMGDRSKFDKVLFTVEGEFQSAAYTLKVESAVESKPIDARQMVFRVFAIGFCLWVYYTYNYYFGSKSQSIQL